MEIVKHINCTEPPEPICGICGEPHKYSDCNLVEIKNHIKDKIIPSKARLTLPEGISVETMADGTYCVIANTYIEKGTQFGPLEAQKLLTLHPSVTFPLKLFNQEVEDFCEYYLDTCDENNCNWMIFVMPAQNMEEQNLMCFQEKSKIFYVTLKEIQAGEFLKVWYSPYYAKKMKKNVLTSQNEDYYNYNNEIIHPIDLNKLLKKQQKIMERDSWTCKFCGKLENDVTLFANHILEHYSKRLKKHCDICKQSFSNLRSLRRHMKSVHPTDANSKKCKAKEVVPDKDKPKDAVVGGPLLNDLLNNDSLDNNNLGLPSIELNHLGITLANSIENQNILLEGDSLSLNVDNLLTENVKELDHFNFEIGESQEQYVCDVCLKVFSKLAYLMQHLKKHTGKYTCRHCLKIFCRGENLNAHKCISDKEPRHICTLCQRAFTLRKYLIRHMNAVHDKKYTCENCNKQYHSNKEYKEHNCSAVPDIYKETYSCVTCNKTFFREVYLRKHQKTHVYRERQAMVPEHLICEVCAHQFSTRKGLQLHMKIHFERTLGCEVCNKKFYRQDVLDNHKATHRDTKVTCTVCNMKLKTKQTLAVHMLLHTGVKPHKCDLCSQAFHQRSTLAKHYSKAHLKTCHLCNKRFATDELLEQHKTEHALKEVFICPLCSKVVKLRSSLRRHLKQFHSEVNTDTVMIDIKPKEVTLKVDAAKDTGNLFINNSPVGDVNIAMASDPFFIGSDINTNLDANDENFENIVENFENIIGSYGSNDPTDLVLGDYENTAGISTEKRTLDFNDLEIDLDSAFGVQQSLNMSNQEVCLSMPDLTELDQEITLGENAYILDNGTIVEPKDKGNVLVYILDKQL